MVKWNRFLKEIVILEKEAIFQLNRYLSGETNLNELSRILRNIGSENVIEAALPLYDKILRERHTAKGSDLDLNEIHKELACMS